MTVGGQQLQFLLDTGASKSVTPQRIAPESGDSLSVIGATGGRQTVPMLQDRQCDLGKKTVTHNFLYIPECPVGLLGRDMLSKLRATITFTEDGMQAHVGDTRILSLTLPLEDEWQLYPSTYVASETPEMTWQECNVPGVWAEDNPPGLARNHAPIIIEMKPGALPVNLRQYPLPRRTMPCSHGRTAAPH